MPRTSATLHGSAPDERAVAILLVDVINDLDFEGGAALREPALAMARTLRPYLAAARRRRIPIVYANDNVGRWRSNADHVIRHGLRRRSRARDLVRLLRPTTRDYIVLKPEGGAFHETTLGTLLHHLGVRRLVLCGIAADRCVLFTAYEAHVRGYALHVPRDCVAAERAEYAKQALDYMARVLDADTSPIGGA